MLKAVRDLIDVPMNVFYIIVTSFDIILLLLWVIALFNNSIQIRRKVRYSTLATYNQDTRLEALNSKVEYRKSLFLFAIVVCELISSLLSNAASIEVLFYNTENYVKLDSGHNDTVANECNKEYNIPGNWEFRKIDLIRILIVLFIIPLNLTFSLVYTLMSYYVMVTKKSLSYNSSLESVDLAREQKVLLLVSSIMCVILLVLLVRVEVLLVFHIVENVFVIIQSILTYKHSRRLIQVLNWKKLDTKIAFGTDSYQYKKSHKSIKSLKRAVFLYITVVVSFSIYVTLLTIRNHLHLLYPSVVSSLFGKCINIGSNSINILNNIVNTLLILDNVPVSVYHLSLFALNIATIPFLLSKINFRCHFSCKCLRPPANKDLGEPLLN